jgi:hypothetical protein
MISCDATLVAVVPGRPVLSPLFCLDGGAKESGEAKEDALEKTVDILTIGYIV